MHTRPSTSTRRLLANPGRLAAGVVTLAVGVGAAAALSNSDRIVAHGFAAALEQPITAAETRTGAQIVGSEEFWLSQKTDNGTGLQRAAWKGSSAALALKVGDRITVTAADGVRTLEVVGVEPAVEGETRIDTAPTASALGVVTCRDVAAPDAPLVRFSTAMAVPGIEARRSVRAL